MIMALLLAALSAPVDGAPLVGQPGEPMVISVGNDVGFQVVSPEEAMKAFAERGELRCGPKRLAEHWKAHGPLYSEHGVTAFEPYVKWMLMEPEEGAWDPSFYDAELAAIKQHGLKWVPFLIAGPAYATPPWFKESDESVFAIDLATGDVSRDQSIWNPHLRPRVRAWLKQFFEHYDPADIQAALLGISGVFGESIYTAGGNIWTWIWDGHYPQHAGWWCGDAYAEADFRAKMKAQYEDIPALNRAWETELASFDEVKPFVPDDTHTMRARLDFIRWYMGSMTDFAEWWVATTRELAPDVPIMMCTGGGASAQLGADMSAQSKMVAKYGAGMRITNEASDYGANFQLTRHIGSACRLYDTYFGYEPAGGVNENGIVARVYNAVASGAWELFHYDNPPRGARGERYKRYLDLMRVREPEIEVGLFWSRTSADLGLAPSLGAAGRAVRDICDVEFIDELMISDGALDGVKTLVWADGPVTEPETAAAIEQAVRGGLTLVVPAGWQPRSPEDDALFPTSETGDVTDFGSYSVPYLPDKPGRPGPWREGKFFGPEPDSAWRTSGRLCWTSGAVTIHVPLSKEPSRIRLPYRVGNLQVPVKFLVDGTLVEEAGAGTQAEIVVNAPAATEGKPEIAIIVDATTWQPSEAGESDDTRQMSVMLRDVIIEPGAGEAQPASPVQFVKAVGQGHVVVATGHQATSVPEALAAIIREPGKHGVPGLSPEASIDARADQVYVTVTTEDLLLYNHGGVDATVQTPQGTVEVPAHSIVSVKR